MISSGSGWHATTIIMVRKGGRVVLGGDGQVSLGATIVKSSARKVRRLGRGDVVAGLAGFDRSHIHLFEQLEAKSCGNNVAEPVGNWPRTGALNASVRQLEAMVLICDEDPGLLLTESATFWSPRLAPAGSVAAVQSGGNYTLARRAP